ncbi:MAG: RbsD/FucU family protein [Dongiaceae bacterium]
MLKGIDPLLNADLLHILRAMGHGDDIVVVDANFPATTMGRRVVRLDGVDATRATEAILSVLPLDDFVDAPAARMEVVGEPKTVPPVCKEFQKLVDAAAGKHLELGRIERFAFYERAKAAYALVATGERRLYGNLLLKKGVIRPK